VLLKAKGDQLRGTVAALRSQWLVEWSYLGNEAGHWGQGVKQANQWVCQQEASLATEFAERSSEEENDRVGE
jgi:hypothetical protein